MAGVLLRSCWPVIRRDIPRYWGKLTEADVEAIGGQYEAFVQALRRAYGFSRVKAEDELDSYLFAFDSSQTRAAA